ncbi:MAG TPA: Uma2 family endonuclease [Pyrinomonadaceae bacterium]|nr:Uma2 family endonuclease [Pyrinomonadaceae bacterium]
MSARTQLVTADELLRMPRGRFRYELVEGELRAMSPAGSEHGAVVINISILLGSHVKANNLGVCFGAETGFKLASGPDTVLAPDLAFVRRERIPPGGLPKKFWPGAPDLAVEVLSPGDTSGEVEKKAGDWTAAGARLVWVLNPRRREVAVYGSSGDVLILNERDELDGGEVVPGFRCEVSELFV